MRSHYDFDPLLFNDSDNDNDDFLLPSNFQRISNPHNDLQQRLITILRLSFNATNDQICEAVKDYLKRAVSREQIDELTFLTKLAQKGMVRDNPARMTKEISIPQEYFLNVDPILTYERQRSFKQSH